MLRSLVGSEMCIRDRYQRRVRGPGSARHDLPHTPKSRARPAQRSARMGCTSSTKSKEWDPRGEAREEEQEETFESAQMSPPETPMQDSCLGTPALGAEFLSAQSLGSDAEEDEPIEWHGESLECHDEPIKCHDEPIECHDEGVVDHWFGPADAPRISTSVRCCNNLEDPPLRDTATWCRTDASRFSVRTGPDYPANKFKTPSLDSLYECVGVDLYRSKLPVAQTLGLVG
eukprot:TRINITY_DN13579_c0_g1_i2.p1 TRINITY_DN13579_c0_g1~~TRINITY_DN13579_c0_g1_i2.p1  ORF type:complete len:257 (+),score=33.23 TRINITY_DN13579_c0_g1_i2:82-771(+)